MTSKGAAPLSKRSGSFKRDYLARWQLYAFLLLPIIYILIFSYYPMAGIQIAFKKYDLLKGIWGSPWIGFGNFTKFFSAYNFTTILYNTLFLAVYSLVASFPLPILFALLLNAFPRQRYKKVVQSVSYMPYFISTVVMVGMLVQLFNPRAGAFGVIYQMLTGNMMPDLLAKAGNFPPMYVWSGVWQNLGWNSIIYVAALSSVDAELHEAAQIDGASRFQRVLYIDYPSILPTAIIMLILAAGQVMNIGFEKVYLMQNKLNLQTSEVISTYVYRVGMVLGTGDFSFATAIGLFNSLINFTLLLIVNWIAGKVSQTSLW